MAKKSYKLIKKLLALYIVDFFFFSVLINLFTYKPSNKLKSKILEGYYSDEPSTDRAAIIEDRKLALTVRSRLLEEAEDSVKILCYGSYEGEISELFYAKILQVADKGVNVQIVFDGLVNNLKGPLNKNKLALINHSNVEIKMYDRIHPLKPWAFNNLLHDKIWIVDDKFALSGGRNLDDRFYLEEERLEVPLVYDRDVLIYNPKNSKEGSSIEEFHRYFQEVWQNSSSKGFRRKFDYRGTRQKARLLSHLNEVENSDNAYWQEPIDWLEISHPTNKVSLVTNPLRKFKQNPHVLEVLSLFFNEADERIIAQSPYVILNKEMREYIDKDSIDAGVQVLTNSLYASPNFSGMAGMGKYEDELMDWAEQIYLYQGKGSVHGKAYVIDDRISLIGSFNLDPRSAFLSTENLVVIDSKAINQVLYENILELMKDSTSKIEDANTLVAVQEAKEASTLKKMVYRFVKIYMYPYDKML